MTADSIPFEPINDKRDHHGPGEVQGNIDALARLFPDAVVDGRVDLGVLADLIGEKTDRSGGEGFGLRWPGMNEARKLSAQPATQTLLPRPGESVDWDTTRNIVIEGDNLEVLRLLRRGYTGTVDVVYIDPPYNTGNDFVYDDKFGASRTETEMAAGLRDENGFLENGTASDLVADRRAGASRHSKWLSMLYPRLLLAHHLLKESGIIIVAIDDTEHSHLRLLLDRVFGAENFAANIVWQGSGRNDSRFTSLGVDYMLLYAKSKALLVDSNVRWTERKKGADEVSNAALRAWESSGRDPVQATQILKEWWQSAPADIAKGLGGSRGYKEIDEAGRVFARGDLRSPNPRENLMYDLLHPVTGKPVKRHPNGWVYSQSTMAQKIAEGRILFGEDESTSPRYKRFLDELEDQPIRPVFEQDRAAAGVRLRRLLGSDVFAYPKDHLVLANWIKTVTQSAPEAVILDFFAGSGSTGHAVMELNAADGGNRRYILVQLDEPVNKDGYATIADITRERLRRAGAQIAQQRTLDGQNIDTGFRSYKLADSNVKPWDGTAELDLLQSVDNLVDGRSTDDLLVEMMLRLGIDLVTPVATREVAGSTLYSLAGTLYAFFGGDLDVAKADEVARAIVGWREEDPVDSDVTVVVRDTGFRDSAAKLNLAAALRQAGITTLRSI
ncbi:site-specific DNA-methyltransferase [Actinosynnema sp. NPDC059797]